MAESAIRADRLNASFKPNPSYTWEIAGKPVVIGISLELVDHLEREVVENFRSLNSRGSEIGGVLLGKIQPGNPSRVSVEGYELIPCDYARGPLYRFAESDVERFERTVAQRSNGAGLRVVGFFRSHTRKGLSLDAEDIAFFSSHFREPQQVALLIRPYASKASTAGFFICENGTIEGETSYREFPFRRADLERGGASDVPAASEEAAAPAPAPVPAESPAKSLSRAQIVPIASRREITLAPPAPAEAVPAKPAPAIQDEIKEAPSPAEKPAQAQNTKMPERPAPGVPAASPERSRGGKLVWIGGASAAALLLLSGMLIYPGLLHKSHPATAQDSSGLSLRVERSAGELLLSWNRDSEAIKNAAHATLSIADGDQHENVDMDLNQLRNGSIVYSPSTADVVFQLSVTGKDSSRVQSESVRVLRTRPSPMPDNTPAVAAKTAVPPANLSAAPAPNTPNPDNLQPDDIKTTPAVAPKPFHAEALAQRLRPARPTDLPDAPGLSGAEPAVVPVPGVNLAPPSPVPPPPAAAVVAPSAVPAPPAAASNAKIGGQVQQAEVVTRSAPDYPIAAKQARVQGSVIVVAVVGADGHVKSAKAVSGPPLLLNSAVNAVKDWVYKPAKLNGAPIESETRVELNFTLER